MTKRLSLATLCAGILLATTAQAQTSPLSVGASASVTDVRYGSQTETGHTWEVNGTWRLTDYTSYIRVMVKPVPTLITPMVSKQN
ncbi:hypothetical protein [Salinivibrio socompensis]|uniref:hypothetical protein n=1 Tax=Salinivibrio socompensis TaxID=1510206 RepID=UPI0004B8C8FB|nr:hypothetical protein [Salinivibrio socompensis]